MKCKNIIQMYLKSDYRTGLPIMVRIHAFFCFRCREEIALMDAHLNILLEDGSYTMERDITNEIMKKIYISKVSHEHTISNLKWIFTGSIILGSMFLISFSNSFHWLKVHFGANLEIPISIVLGLAMSIYAILFVGTHLDDLKEYLDSLIKKF